MFSSKERNTFSIVIREHFTESKQLITGVSTMEQWLFSKKLGNSEHSTFPQFVFN